MTPSAVTTRGAINVVKHKDRRKMLDQMVRHVRQGGEGGLSPVFLARKLDMPVNLAAYHITVMLRAGVVELVGTEPRRGSTEHFYRPCVSVQLKAKPGPAKIVFRAGRAFRESELEPIIDPIPRKGR